MRQDKGRTSSKMAADVCFRVIPRLISRRARRGRQQVPNKRIPFSGRVFFTVVVVVVVTVVAVVAVDVTEFCVSEFRPVGRVERNDFKSNLYHGIIGLTKAVGVDRVFVFLLSILAYRNSVSRRRRKGKRFQSIGQYANEQWRRRRRRRRKTRRIRCGRR